MLLAVTTSWPDFTGGLQHQAYENLGKEFLLKEETPLADYIYIVAVLTGTPTPSASNGS